MEIRKKGNLASDLVLIQLTGDHEVDFIEKEIEEIKKNTGMDFCMVVIKVDDWNADLSPWQAPAVFKDAAFAGRGPVVLQKVQEICADQNKEYIIGGYSLAGLFALWATYQLDGFAAVAAASPSVWFPGFLEYVKEHEIMSPNVYLSLGNKEEKTRNAVMASVGDKIREIHSWLSEKGINCELEWNQGNPCKPGFE